MTELEERIGYAFRNAALLERALNTLSLIRERLTVQSPAPEPVRPQPTAASGRLMLKHR